jgi:hypothetical protein
MRHLAPSRNRLPELTLDDFHKVRPMPCSSTSIAFWSRWLQVVTIVVCMFGLTMVFAPGITQQFFGLICYSSSQSISSFGDKASAYIQLMHAVLGAVMFGWGMALMLIVLGPFRRGSKEGWRMIAISLAAWSIPDTGVSFYTGFWQNSILNLVIVVFFAAPLLAAYREFFPPNRDES